MCDISIKPIRSEAEYAAAQARLAALADAPPDTPGGRERELLADLAEYYEYANTPTPLFEYSALISYWIDRKGWTAQGIADLLGGGDWDIRELLSGEQTLTAEMAETLSRHLGVPAAELLRVANSPPQPGVIPPLCTVDRVAARYG